MAFDGIFLSFVKNEISAFAIDTRVDKIHQPSRDELLITLRGREGAKKLLLSCRADSARVQFTSYQVDNPAKPPMLTMLLRKKLLSSRLIAITQPSLERLLQFEFLGANELGDKVTYYLICEIMGRSSNIILCSEDMTIIDAVKRVDISANTSRIIMPGEKYIYPKRQDKLNIFSDDINEIKSRISGSEKSVSKACQDVLLGVSPIICREIENGLSLDEFKNELKSPIPRVIIMDTPKDFTFIPIKQYGSLCSQKTFDTFSSLLDYFFYERVRSARIKMRSSDLIKTVTTLCERAYRKAENRKAELKECEDKEKYRIWGDLITSSQYNLQKGSMFYDIENYYNDNKTERISADPRLTPSQNAQRYYKEYRKKQIAQEKLTSFIDEATKEAKYLDSVLDLLSRAETDSDITAIKTELAKEGYLKSRNINEKSVKASAPLEYVSTNGYKILVGKNNLMNDKLTLKTALPNDIWFHVKDTQGSHVIVACNNNDLDDKTIHEAALIAAYNSKARLSSNVAVDYTKVRFVKKPSGAKPGRVIYTDYKTEFVTPTADEIERLKK